MSTRTQEIKNMRLISHVDLNGHNNLGEGVDLHQTASGRRIFYMAHEGPPKDFTSVDVTDLSNPNVVAQTDLDYNHLRSNSLSIVGDTMLVAYQSREHGQPGAGMGVFDISNPEAPSRIAFYDAQGPGSRGCHCLWWVDGNYAHLATGTPDSSPTDLKDDQYYVIMDVKDPANPKEAGRWWLPGTQEGDDAPPPARHPQFDVGHSVHNTNVYPNRPDRAYCGWKDSGIVTLDISDVSRPSMVAHLNYAPPFPGFTHTVLPLFSRDLLVVTQEATMLGGADYPKLVWMMDNRLESNPVIISTLPMQDTDDFFNRPAATARTTSMKTVRALCPCNRTPWCTPLSLTGESGCSTPAIPSSPKRSLTSCPGYPKAPTPTASTTCMWTKTASCTWWTGCRVGCTFWS